jgi:hypothetical protein
MDPASVHDAIARSVQYFVDQKVVFHPSSGSGRREMDYQYNNHAEDPIYLRVEALAGTDCPVLDFGADTAVAVARAQRAFGTVLNNCTSPKTRIGLGRAGGFSCPR